MSVMCFCYIQVTVRSICFCVNNYLVIFDLCLTTLTAVHLDVKLFSLLHSKKIFNSFKFAITHKYNWWLFKKYIYIWFTTSLPASIFAVLFFLVVQKWQGHILSSYWDRKYRHKLTNLLQNLYFIFLVHSAANGIFFFLRPDGQKRIFETFEIHPAQWFKIYFSEKQMLSSVA